MPVVWEPQLDANTQRWLDLAATETEQHFAPLAGEVDHEQRYPWESVRLRSSGLAAMFLPVEYGGGGASLVAIRAAMESVAEGCTSTSAILSTYMLGSFPVLLAGTPEQRSRYLGGLARDGEAVSFARTERDSDSDAAGIDTIAIRERDGCRLCGTKWFIGNGGPSDHYIVFAKLKGEE